MDSKILEFGGDDGKWLNHLQRCMSIESRVTQSQQLQQNSTTQRVGLWSCATELPSPHLTNVCVVIRIRTTHFNSLVAGSHHAHVDLTICNLHIVPRPH